MCISCIYAISDAGSDRPQETLPDIEFDTLLKCCLPYLMILKVYEGFVHKKQEGFLLFPGTGDGDEFRGVMSMMMAAWSFNVRGVLNEAFL